MTARKVVRIVTAMLVVISAAAIFFFFALAPITDRTLNRVDGEPVKPVSDRARVLHDSLLIADLHADQLLWPRDLLDRAGHGHVDLPRLRDGNVAVQVFSVVSKTPRGLNYERNSSETDNITLLGAASRWPIDAWSSLLARARYQASKLHEAVAESNGTLAFVGTADDLDEVLARRAKGDSVIGGLLALEGLQVLEGELANVDTLFAHGYRMFGLTHFFDNEVAGSAHGELKGGLTPLGRGVVQRVEQLQGFIDLAHASPAAIDEVLSMATRPVVVSHTGVRATCAGTRNLSDDQVRRIAATGGVIGIGFWDAAVCDISPQSIARAIIHVVSVAGADHVGLGSDFDGSTVTRFDATGLAHITSALVDAGMPEEDIARVMGGNVIRLLREQLPRRQAPSGTIRQ
jgi:membrane dipeptidase